MATPERRRESGYFDSQSRADESRFFDSQSASPGGKRGRWRRRRGLTTTMITRWRWSSRWWWWSNMELESQHVESPLASREEELNTRGVEDLRGEVTEKEPPERSVWGRVDVALVAGEETSGVVELGEPLSTGDDDNNTSRHDLDPDPDDEEEGNNNADASPPPPVSATMVAEVEFEAAMEKPGLPEKRRLLEAVNILQVISVMFVGHLGELPLSGASMATSFAGVSGFSFLMGMGSALDTLCGQAFGAKQYYMLGIHMQRAMFVLTIVSIPLAIIWAYTGEILVAFGQDPDISTQAGIYARWMIPILFAYGLLQCLVRFLQTQNIVVPMMISSAVATLLHIVICWVLVFKSGLGHRGAALAISISYWINVILLALYIKFSPSCKKTWTGFSSEALRDILNFIKLAIPSTAMLCLEFWSFEMLVLLSGLLPNPTLETSVLSISLNTGALVFMIPFGLSSAVSTRVSNELGAGRPKAARLAVCIVVALALTEGLIVGVIMILARNLWGYAYSNEEEVVKYVAIMMPILAISNFIDGFQAVLAGVARGCGWQKIGAFVNLGAYYIAGIPAAILLAFVFHIRGKGLWMGIICGLFVQAVSYLTITICTDWEKEMEGEERSTIESSLIPSSHEKSEEDGGDGGVVAEVKKQLFLAGPLIASSLLQKILQVISVMFVGHLGELPLAGASMATSFAGVSGFGLLMGMGSALDTLCGQAYGAKQYYMLGIHMQRGMFVLTLVSIPVGIIWAYTGEILVAFGQDPDISAQAGIYARWMIPILFAYGILQCLIKFLQTQNIVVPMMISSAVTTLLHFVICWILVFKSGLGHRGAALAISISYWINVILLALYIKFSPACKKTWTGFSSEALHDILNFIKLAIPSTVMVCLEFWSFEMLVLLSGLLPNPTLETSVLSISLNTIGMVFMIPFGLSSAVSTRVSNELGAGHPKTARLAACIVVALAITEGLIVGLIMIFARNLWGYAYSNEEEVVKYVAIMMPILAISNFFDGIQAVLSGTARGCGWQTLGACVNLGAYYIVGIPASILLAFVFHIGGKGLWIGIICALFVQAVSFLAITLSTDWEKEAKKAKERVYSSTIPIDHVS
ncbi:hypothetical protein J5N97_027888 [Dioscorea zingiberensis]|uniref:Protein DETOXIFICATION n=1 Tax=Dioscorea zingiberensis TaxID=325984 RepID=A0A9D5BXP7_9LILI|nr:hypothetical protein J5N97_027888 [Dioscorea zingiberensis]